MCLFKESFPMYPFSENSGGELLEKEALVSPISSTELYDIDSIVSTNIILFKV